MRASASGGSVDGELACGVGGWLNCWLVVEGQINLVCNSSRPLNINHRIHYYATMALCTMKVVAAVAVVHNILGSQLLAIASHLSGRLFD